FSFFFFFQAEDGIRDFHVTGVQTCALPILAKNRLAKSSWISFKLWLWVSTKVIQQRLNFLLNHDTSLFEVVKRKLEVRNTILFRSEERRVGKECRYRWWLNE